MNYERTIFETDDEYMTYIFNTLSDSQLPFCVFDVPFQEHFKNSRYPIDMIVGLYSTYDKMSIFKYLYQMYLLVNIL